MSDEIRGQAERVLEVRQQVADTETLLAFERRQWEELHADSIAFLKSRKATLAYEEDELRRLALATYQDDPTNKKPGPGVAIRMVTRWEYDAQLALEWVVEHGLVKMVKLDAIAFLKSRKATLAYEEDELRRLALATYQDDPTNKKPGPGVAIRMVTRWEYDAQLALEWVVEHGLVKMVKLDAKAFEKAAPALGLLDVTLVEEAQATISTNLSKALGLEQEQGE